MHILSMMMMIIIILFRNVYCDNIYFRLEGQEYYTKGPITSGDYLLKLNIQTDSDKTSFFVVDSENYNKFKARSYFSYYSSLSILNSNKFNLDTNFQMSTNFYLIIYNNQLNSAIVQGILEIQINDYVSLSANSSKSLNYFWIIGSFFLLMLVVILGLILYIVNKKLKQSEYVQI